MGLLTSLTFKKFEFHKSKMADGRHFENHEYWPLSAMGLTHSSPLRTKLFLKLRRPYVARPYVYFIFT